MARRTVWSERAEADLAEIINYIAADSVQHAARLYARILKSVDRLADFPLSGRALPESLHSGYREIICGNYRVIYEFSDAEVYIVAVVHGRRSLGV